MEKILYDLMDWAGIEELVYSEASDPGRILGEHVIKEGLLIQAFLPNAEKVSVKIGEEQFLSLIHIFLPQMDALFSFT